MNSSATTSCNRHRAPILDYRCRTCGAVFNLFSGTLWATTRYRCSIIVQILRGTAQGVPTKHLAEELGIDRRQLLERRHRIQAIVEEGLSPSRPLPDEITEVNGLYQNAGEKRRKHHYPGTHRGDTRISGAGMAVGRRIACRLRASLGGKAARST